MKIFNKAKTTELNFKNLKTTTTFSLFESFFLSGQHYFPMTGSSRRLLLLLLSLLLEYFLSAGAGGDNSAVDASSMEDAVLRAEITQTEQLRQLAEAQQQEIQRLEEELHLACDVLWQTDAYVFLPLLLLFALIDDYSNRPIKKKTFCFVLSCGVPTKNSVVSYLHHPFPRRDSSFTTVVANAAAAAATTTAAAAASYRNSYMYFQDFSNGDSGEVALKQLKKIGFRPSVVFDIGANTGESAKLLLSLYNDDPTKLFTLHSFEPVPRKWLQRYFSFPCTACSLRLD